MQSWSFECADPTSSLINLWGGYLSQHDQIGSTPSLNTEGRESRTSIHEGPENKDHPLVKAEMTERPRNII